MTRRARALLLVGSLIVAAIPVGAISSTEAAATMGPRTYTRSVLASSRGLNHPARFGRAILLRTPGMTLAAGESRHLRAHLEAVNRGWVAELRAVIRCHDAAGRELNRTTTSRNHEGADAPRRLDESDHGMGRIGYPARGVLAIEVNHLFVAPGDGTFRCRLDGEGNPKGRTRSDKMIALKKVTWLEVSEPHSMDRGNVMWHAGDDDSSFDGPCDAHGEWSSCRYLIPKTTAASYPCPSSYDRWARVFGGAIDRWDPVALFRPDVVATRVDVTADVELTNCNGSSSCTRRLRGCGERKAVAYAKTRLEIVPVFRDDDGSLRTCGQAVYDPPGTYHRKRITPATHHDKMHHRGSIAVDRSGACGLDPLILIRIKVGAVKGNPLKIDGAHMTSAVAMNLA